MLLATTCSFAAAGSLRAQGDLAQKSQEATQAMHAGHFAAAVALYRELVQALPDNPGLRLDLGLALHSENKYREAIVQFQAAARHQPDLEPSWLMLGLTYLELDQPRDAINPLECALRLDPSDERARLQLAGADLSLKKPEEATREYQKVTDADPGNPKAWQGLGLSYAAASRQTFAMLEKEAPDSAYHDVLLAQSLTTRGQDRTAFYWYRQALAKDSHFPGVHAALAQIYRRSGHPDWESVEESREHENGNPDCSQKSPECEFLAGRFSEVVTMAGRDERPQSLYWKAQAFEQLSAQALDRLAAMPPSPEVHELMAQADATKGDARAAIEEWKEALKLAPDAPNLKQGLAYALWLDGDYPQAEPLLIQMVELHPESAEIHFELGNSLLAMGSAEKAIPELERAVKLNPALAPAQASLGRAYLRAGRPQDAVPHLKAGLASDVRGTALYELAQAYKATGQKALGDATLRKFQQTSTAALERSAQMDREHEITAP